MQATIKAEERELNKIFCNDFAFDIPSYQRPYSWGREQAGELLDDLLFALEGDEGGDIKEVPPYFLGSIVLIKDPGDTRADVVDGQQRLTTLTILFAVLRELADGTVADSLHQRVCESGDPLTDAKDRFRLTLRDREREYFRTCIQERGGLARLAGDDAQFTEPKRNIRNNALLLRERLAAMTEKDRNRLASFLLQRCFLVVVSASDQASAYRIFSVMNDRGLDLSAADILKADVIGKIEPEPRREAYTEVWEDLEEDLGRGPFEDLFGHIRMIHAKSKSKRHLVEEFREHVRPAARPADFIDRELVPYAKAFGAVAGESYVSTHLSGEINGYLKHLNRLDNADWVPSAVLFFARHEGEPERLLPFVRDLERLAYAFFVTRTMVNQRIQRYAEVLTAIEHGADLHAEGSPLQLTATQREAMLGALDGPIYAFTRVRLPLLLRLDSLLSDGGATYDHKLVTVEHVLPQNPAPGGEWTKTFPDPEWRKSWVHRLGNLALLSSQKNSAAGNLPFARKKREYFQARRVTTFALTTQIVNEAEWTPEVLEARQRKLTKLLATEWRL